MVRSIAIFTLCALASCSSLALAQQEQSLAQKAHSILKQHCYKCHGIKFEVPQFNVMDRETLVAKRPNELSLVAPEDLENSSLWQRLGVDGDMPPEKVTERLTEEDIEIIKEWILAGAEFPQVTNREFISERQVLDAIFSDLRKVNSRDRDSQRYFTLTHLHNNQSVTDAELRLFRAAFVKLVNSLHGNGDLVRPVLIDTQEGDFGTGTIFRLDLDEVGWLDPNGEEETSPWEQLVKTYPYGLKWNAGELQDLNNDIESMLDSLTRDAVRYIRVDWFVKRAAQPANYHALLDIPETAKELEDRLSINVKRDFERDDLIRAGFAGSGVSKNNRLVDRHTGQTQYYYRSYDFAKSFGRGVIFRFPLGPKFEGDDDDEFADQAFEHDGGEIIYRLPNGMQGYMLVDKDGQRIDLGPIEIVRDLNEIAGTPQIVNALSCIGCHRHGIQMYEDSIRDSFALVGEARQKLNRIYRDNEEITKTLNRDRTMFLETLDSLIGPYLKIGPDADKSIIDFPEPVTVLAGWYDKDLSLEDAARELSLQDPRDFSIRGNRKLLLLGLGPLSNDGKIPRPMWDSLEEAGASVFQRSANELQLGQGVKN